MRAPTAAASEGVATPVVIMATMVRIIEAEGQDILEREHIFVRKATFSTSYRGASSG